MINLWIKEHQHDDVRLKYVTQSALSKHNIETGHQILFDKMTTIVNVTSYFPRNRESIEIQKHNNNLNRDNDYNINKIWKTILLIIKDWPISPTSPSLSTTLFPLPSNKQLNIKNRPEEQPNNSVSGSSPWWRELQDSRNVDIPRMELDTEKTHNLYIQSIRETHNLYKTPVEISRI